MNLWKAIALLGLAATAFGPVLTFAGVLDVAANKHVLLAGMILWFLGAPPWLSGRKFRPGG
ncbi:MAG: hypothetical protein GVY10_00255 [Verrucomicrobia bacterium]|jgi:hypothetical protein|nr:hypothetical protein [Verrucomicrobiota bacterium]